MKHTPEYCHDPLQPYDAVVVCSYGGPRKMDDVLPFMRNATKGRGVPDSRLLEVSGHYQRYHGVSPINARNNEILHELTRQLRQRGVTVPIVIGNRNWTPFFHDVFTDLYQQGARNILALFTSAYVCYSGCRQYREDLAATLLQMESQDMTGMNIDKARAFYTTEGFIEVNTDCIVRAYAQQKKQGYDTRNTRLLMVTHSVPEDIYRASGPVDNTRPDYEKQHQDVGQEVVRRVEQAIGHPVNWELCYCSRSGPPHIPWLEPDVNDVIEKAHEQGVPSVIVSPIGFICDHMEVVFDLDTEAKETAEQLGMGYLRADTPGADPRFVASLADVLCERAAQARGELFGQHCGVGVGFMRAPDDYNVDGCDQDNEYPVAHRVYDLSIGLIDDAYIGFRATDALQPTWPAVSPVGDSRLAPDAQFIPTVCGG